MEKNKKHTNPGLFFFCVLVCGLTGAFVTQPSEGPSPMKEAGFSDILDEDAASLTVVEESDTDAAESADAAVESPDGAEAEAAAPAVPDGYRDLQIENLRFVDKNSNRTIDAGERAKLVFEIRNAGPTTVYNVTPVVGVTGTKKVMVSPTAIVASIAPGRSVRYTAELYGKPSLRRGMADFTISFAYGQYLYTVRSFQLQTGR